jgi:zinc and cadmium transporter
MSLFLWIILATFGMSLIAWIGLFTLAIKEEILKNILAILVAFSAGALLGGAFFHLIPESIKKIEDIMILFIWVIIGFSLFFLMEQFLNWHHSHKISSEYKKPVSYLILVADGLHNFIGGFAIASSFMISIEVGIITWISCAVHEIPQELGDFGILIYSGWKKSKALIFNFLSALTIVPAAILIFLLSNNIETTFLLPFAAGNFIYIAASDLIPEIKHHDNRNGHEKVEHGNMLTKKLDTKSITKRLIHFCIFLVGIFLILLVRIIFG